MSFMGQKYSRGISCGLMCINPLFDISQSLKKMSWLVLNPMIFSKSFGYAIRSILYVSMRGNEGRKIQTLEISKRLNIPHHFLGKIMQKLAEKGILESTKGPYGGFSMNNNSYNTPLLDILMITDGDELFHSCSLRLKRCNASQPCPMHSCVVDIRDQLKERLTSTTIASLQGDDLPDFIRSISSGTNQV